MATAKTTAKKPAAKKASSKKTTTKKPAAKKRIDWGNLPFGYMETSKSFVATWKNGKWDAGKLTTDHTVKISECAGVLQYAQTCFEGLKAYTTEHGDIVTFRPDLNAERMENSCKHLKTLT